nr:hypothetical protein [Actinomycetota bacterium]
LLASAIVEIVGGFFHRRSKNLWDTIDLMLGNAEIGEDDDARKLVDRIYREPFVTKLVQPKAQALYPKEIGEGRTTPGLRSYKSALDASERKRRFHGPQNIAPQAFAKAFIEVIQPGGNVDTDVATLKAEIAKLPEEISKPIGALLNDAGDDFVKARSRIEDWYETHMKSVSIWYRKQTRYFLFAAGLVIAVVGNVDAVGATKTLYRDQAVRESVLAQAGTIGRTECEVEVGANAQVDCLRGELGGAVSLPVGWSDLDRTSGAWTLRIVGWLLIAGAVTVGAPFWFDLLRRALAHRKASDG